MQPTASFRTKSVEALDAENLPIYYTCEFSRPHSKRYVEVTSQNVLENARRKNLLWVLVRLHADAKQKVSGRTSSNISVRIEVKVRQDSVEYLPTIHVPAASMSTVHSLARRL